MDLIDGGRIATKSPGPEPNSRESDVTSSFRDPLTESPQATVIQSDEVFHEALALRYEVFCDEQGVPRELEHDEEDALAVHVVVRDASGAVCATGRLLRMRADGSLHDPRAEGEFSDVARIGRMAVRRDVRGHGIGRIVLLALEAEGRRHGLRSSVLHAQLRAAAFYEACGYTRRGGEFDEAGIVHVEMWKPLG